jgi:hypothetical protein
LFILIIRFNFVANNVQRRAAFSSYNLIFNQMSITTCCPKATYLSSAVTTLYPCPQEFGQIQKLIFWRRGQKLTAVASAVISTTWTAKLVATGDSKALVVGFVIGKVTAGDPREAGGGNETKNGIPVVIGQQPSSAEFMAIQFDQDVIKALKKLQCEALDVLFINENGQFMYADTIYGGTASGFYGFPIQGLSVNDLEFGDFDGKDQNKIKFYLPPNWSNDAEISAATAFALTLINS